MRMSVFGTPITDQTLKQMSRYMGKTITQEDRAREAMRMMQAEGKNLSALKYVGGFKAEYGNGVTTLCLIYNATGDKLEIAHKQDWLGYVYKQEPPRSFDNGQWLAFLHAHPTAQAYGCEAARVYRGKNVKGQIQDFMVAWSTPWGSSYQNSAYTEVGERDQFPKQWDSVKGILEEAGKVTRYEIDQCCCTSAVSIGGVTSSEFIAVLSHKFSSMP